MIGRFAGFVDCVWGLLARLFVRVYCGVREARRLSAVARLRGLGCLRLPFLFRNLPVEPCRCFEPCALLFEFVGVRAW